MFQQARKSQTKLRLAVEGPAGSGKTYTALLIAKGLGGPICLIDTEYGKASLYADRFNFQTSILEAFTIDDYVREMQAAEGQCSVLIIDSLSHAWESLCAQNDDLARKSFSGNTWAAWSKNKPRQRDFMRRILAFPGHVIATMRTRTEWTLQDDGKGRQKPVRVGLAPKQEDGLEYEFSLVAQMTPEHQLIFLKDGTGTFQDKTIDCPGEDFGKRLAAWLAEDLPPASGAPFDAGRIAGSTPSAKREELDAVIAQYGIAVDAQQRWCAYYKVADLDDLSDEQCGKIILGAHKNYEGQNPTPAAAPAADPGEKPATSAPPTVSDRELIIKEIMAHKKRSPKCYADVLAQHNLSEMELDVDFGAATKELKAVLADLKHSGK